MTLVLFLVIEQGKIVAKLLPTEERLRHACMRKVPQKGFSKQNKTKFREKVKISEQEEEEEEVTAVIC